MRLTALSDTELEINERHSSWKHGGARRKEVSTKVSPSPPLLSPCTVHVDCAQGESSAQGRGKTADADFKKRLEQHKVVGNGEEMREREGEGG